MQVAGNLGNQHRIGTHGDASLQRQPAGLRAQDFDHGNFAGRLRCLPGLVEHLDGEAEGAVETERIPVVTAMSFSMARGTHTVLSPLPWSL